MYRNNEKGFDLCNTDILNEEGKEGWELVNIIRAYGNYYISPNGFKVAYILKRCIDDSE